MLYAKIKGQPYLGSSLHSLPDLFRWISYSSCEDLVALYLQHKGYSIIPSTNKKSTAEYEFELVHRDTGSVAAVQVKNGKTSLDCLKYAAVPFKVYLFTSEGQYLNSESRPQNVEIVDRETLVAFADECRHMLPDTIRLWVEYLKP
jgi:Holliday junction resolvase-like predicted endonuclease